MGRGSNVASSATTPTFDEFLEKIAVEAHRTRMKEVLSWVQSEYPQLEGVVKWNQPMFQDHGTFILGFSAAKKHYAFTPEEHTISVFEEQIRDSGLSYTKGIVRVPWDAPIPTDLLREFIEFNIEDKADVTTFWRP